MTVPVKLTCGARLLTEKMRDYATNPDEELCTLYDRALTDEDDRIVNAFRRAMNSLTAQKAPIVEMRLELTNMFYGDTFEFTDGIGLCTSVFVCTDIQGHSPMFGDDEEGPWSSKFPFDDIIAPEGIGA